METKTALITGGSRGIGRELVDTFLESGYRVIATCRDKTKSKFMENKNLQNLNFIQSGKFLKEEIVEYFTTSKRVIQVHQKFHQNIN